MRILVRLALLSAMVLAQDSPIHAPANRDPDANSSIPIRRWAWKRSQKPPTTAVLPGKRTGLAIMAPPDRMHGE